MTNDGKAPPGSMGGTNGHELASHLGELGSGGNTVAGAGDPSGGPIGGTPGSSAAALGGDGAIAAEAAALGSVDGTLADAAAQAQPGAERLSAGPTGGESIGTGAGRGEVGSGTPRDTGELGGGGAEGTVHGTASPGGDGRA
jgi:hypothetical protein